MSWLDETAAATKPVEPPGGTDSRAHEVGRRDHASRDPVCLPRNQAGDVTHAWKGAGPAHDDHDRYGVTSDRGGSSRPATNVVTTRSSGGEQGEIGVEPGRHRPLAREAEHPGRGRGDRRDGLGRRAPGEGDEVPHGLVERQRAAGEGPVGEPDAVVAERHRPPAEREAAGGPAECGHRVGDEIEARRPQRPPGRRHRDRVDVDPVRDQSRGEPAVGQRHADRSRIAVAEGGHAVVQVRDVGDPRGDGPLELLCGGCGVTGGDDDTGPDELLDHREAARQLGREGHERDARGPSPPRDELRRRRPQEGGIVGAPASRVQHRPLEVQAQGFGSGEAAWPIGERAHRPLGRPRW